MKYKCDHCRKTFSTENECLEHEKKHLPPYWEVLLKYYLYGCEEPKIAVSKVKGKKWDWAMEEIKMSGDGDIVWLSKCVREKGDVAKAKEELKEKAIKEIQDDIGRLSGIMEEVKKL